MYYGPKDWEQLDRYTEKFGGRFICLDDSGVFCYEKGEDAYVLADSNDEKLFGIIEESCKTGKSLIPERFPEYVPPFPLDSGVQY